MEYKRLLICASELQKERVDDFQTAETMRCISHANEARGLHKEGTRQLKEALDIYKQLNLTIVQAKCWQQLGRPLYRDGQLDAAEETASRAIDLFSDTDQQAAVCECYRTLGDICQSKGVPAKAIGHLETALGIATRSNWLPPMQFWIHCSLAQLPFEENKFDDAHAHIERAKSHAINDRYRFGRAMKMQAWSWYRQRMFEEAKSEALGAPKVYGEVGPSKDVEDCKVILRDIEEATSR